MVAPTGQMRDAVKVLSPPFLSDDSPRSPQTPTGGVGGRFMYNLGLASDALLEKVNQGVKARMPGVGDPSALPLIGNDRVMTQGPGETNTAFASRLQQSFDIWQRAGSARAVLELVAGYTAGQQGTYAGQVPIAAIVGGYRAEKWDWLYNTSPVAPPVHYQEPAPNWVWDGKEASEWWRSWLVLYSYLNPPTRTGATATVASNSGNFFSITGLTGFSSGDTSLAFPGYLTLSGAASSGNNGTHQITQVLSPSSVVLANPAGVALDANDGAIAWELAYFEGLQPKPVIGFPGKVIGNGGNTNVAIGVMLPGAASSANTPGYFAQLRALLALWKSAQTYYDKIIISFGGGTGAPGSEFSPWSSAGAGNPNGWGSWAKVVNGRYVAARSTGSQLGAFDAICGGTATYLPNSYVQVT